MFHLLKISLLQTREKEKLYPLFVESVHVTFKEKAQGKMRFSFMLKKWRNIFKRYELLVSESDLISN
ncbi:hypothetical protein AT246_04050 [Bartonella henselae]|uniref:Uncharacterized protein n=1 Tax=Bartonella henselae (strain ATCC 49882 / DSM 28221 / CCUG 30454 / Houston 1) TaxID=283166 RepID=A0A0H3LY98_BARHE|nr:hypothetical protein BhenCHDE101_08500 [Bartonella henselae]CAF28394.1 hypothetical protein BH16320 [Bartonella henselae str. Houston-1]OLL40447.1 hypothetical protein AT244_06075 [Bartonella henselae]OLL44796.1 hypothetical protein AT245_01295 [Bartonella henselae]OLL46905.1 hypothetical protein AT242_06380 [Bartonella henselae]